MSDFYLPRPQQRELLELLTQIPALVEDLTIAITKQDRLTPAGPRTTRGDDVQPLPFNEHASDAARFVFYTIAWWTRHTCEHRNIDYTGTNDVLSCARWLRIHIIDLALTPGSETSLEHIRNAIRNGNRACNGPEDRAVIHHGQHDLSRARYATLNARGIAALAIELRNPDYRTLTEQRVYRLARAGVITPDRVITLDGQDCALYVLGDVLDAHVSYPSRSRKAVPA